MDSSAELAEVMYSESSLGLFCPVATYSIRKPRLWAYKCGPLVTEGTNEEIENGLMQIHATTR